MDIRLKWVNVDLIDSEETFVVETEQETATHAVISKEFLKHLLHYYIDPYEKIGGSFNTQCPDCGFVAEGFDTEEEAAIWTCDECSPTLPFDELSEE